MQRSGFRETLVGRGLREVRLAVWELDARPDDTTVRLGFRAAFLTLATVLAVVSTTGLLLRGWPIVLVIGGVLGCTTLGVQAHVGVARVLEVYRRGRHQAPPSPYR